MGKVSGGAWGKVNYVGFSFRLNVRGWGMGGGPKGRRWPLFLVLSFSLSLVF